MHPIKTNYGREPNRLVETLLVGGINNKQDSSTLDIAKGECVEIINIDIANTSSSRTGYIPSALPSTYTATSNSHFVDVNGVWVENISLGLNFNTGLAHKLPMATSPTAILEFYKGRIYALINVGTQSTLYCSDPWDIDTMDERHCVVATFEETGTLLGRTDDGLVVGTTNQIIYLQGNDPAVEGKFSQRFLAYYGGIKNTMARTTGDKIPASKMQGRVCIFTTHQGVCVVGNGGNFINLSLNTFSYNYSDTAAAFIREKQGQIHYIVSFVNTEDNSFNEEIDAVTITDSN